MKRNLVLILVIVGSLLGFALLVGCSSDPPAAAPTPTQTQEDITPDPGSNRALWDLTWDQIPIGVRQDLCLTWDEYPSQRPEMARAFEQGFEQGAEIETTTEFVYEFLDTQCSETI